MKIPKYYPKLTVEQAAFIMHLRARREEKQLFAAVFRVKRYLRKLSTQESRP